MSRTEPRAFLRFLVDEWPVIDSIHERSRRGHITPSVLRAIARDGSSSRIIERMLELNIVNQLPNSTSFEMGTLVRDLLDELKREHSLGLADEIRIHLEDMGYRGDSIADAVDESDHRRMERHALALEDRVRNLHRRIANNDAAIDEIVTQAKTRKRHTPLKQRYAEVLEAWERYVEPVRSMVDPTGAFEALFERLEADFNRALVALHSRGALAAERDTIELLRYRLIRLRGLLQAHLGKAAEALLPLVREVRRNSAVARGAALALKEVRAGRWDAGSLSRLVPFTRRVSPTAVSSDDRVEAYLAGVGEYTDTPQPFVAPQAGPSVSAPVFDEEAVLARLRRHTPIPDLMAWLIESCADEADAEDILDMYLRVRDPETGLNARAGEVRIYHAPPYRLHAPLVSVDAPNVDGDAT